MGSIEALADPTDGVGTADGRRSRRSLFRSLRRPVVAAAVLAVGLASSGGLQALPAAADDIEYCDVDPVAFVDVNGATVGVKVHLGWPVGSNPLVDRAATNASVVATAKGAKITVTATVVAPGHSDLPTRLQVELLTPGSAPSRWTYGRANSPMSASISA